MSNDTPHPAADEFGDRPADPATGDEEANETESGAESGADRQESDQPAPVSAWSHAAGGAASTTPIFDDQPQNMADAPADRPGSEAGAPASDAAAPAQSATSPEDQEGDAAEHSAVPAASETPNVDATTPAAAVPAAAVSADTVPADTVPSAVVPTEAGPVATPTAPVQPVPVYVTAPTPPRAKGNRLMGILIAVVASVAFAVVYAAVVLGLFALRAPNLAVTTWEHYLPTAGFWVPIVIFFLAYVLLIAIVNRGGWWAYVLGSFFVGVIVYFGYIGGALLTVQAWTLSIGQTSQFIATLWTSPLTIAAAIVAREVGMWFGAWVAARGRRVRERNLAARREYDRALDAGNTV